MPASAQTDDEQEKAFISMYNDQSIVTATRSSKPLSQVAENVTIITADDIKLSGAHTLVDVLNNITGVQVFTTGGPGSIASVSLQGSDTRHVTVAIDGVIINNLSGNTADIAAIPVQDIERIEIIKGPASSVWGSALGGIINIITKSADTTKKAKGELDLMYGERSTNDSRSEIYGKLSQFRYYFYAGRFVSDGFRPFNAIENNNVFTKLIYHAGVSDMVLSLSYTKGNRGILQDQPDGLDIGDAFNYLRSSLSFNTKVADNIDFSLAMHALQQQYHQDYSLISSGEDILRNYYNDTDVGGSVKVIWKADIHNVVFGCDYDSGILRSNNVSGLKKGLDKAAVFINDSITAIPRLTITPGLRYDDTNTSGDFVSPSLGVTYKLSEVFLLRAETARGFNVPPLSYTYGDGSSIIANPNLKVENVTSYQTGFETTAIPFIDLKVMLFHHIVGNAIALEALTPTTSMLVNQDKDRRQGIESEISTTPIYNISLTAGSSFIGYRNMNTNSIIPNEPTCMYDFGLKYNDGDSLKALLKGHYIWWNAEAAEGAKYNALIVDADISKVLARNKGVVWETFLAINNIFNGAQYAYGSYKNPRRWVEGGVRISF
ncbi:MAG TPA: TonB-dependent receptor [Dissulfurispiraceae bacterium]|nr:TonB-dependent receptor [Dissulfurispiraceae bacterium]